MTHSPHDLKAAAAAGGKPWGVWNGRAGLAAEGRALVGAAAVTCFCRHPLCVGTMWPVFPRPAAWLRPSSHKAPKETVRHPRDSHSRSQT